MDFQVECFTAVISSTQGIGTLHVVIAVGSRQLLYLSFATMYELQQTADCTAFSGDRVSGTDPPRWRVFG
jgi:hypothetical protein